MWVYPYNIINFSSKHDHLLNPIATSVFFSGVAHGSKIHFAAGTSGALAYHYPVLLLVQRARVSLQRATWHSKQNKMRQQELSASQFAECNSLHHLAMHVCLPSCSKTFYGATEIYTLEAALLLRLRTHALQFRSRAGKGGPMSSMRYSTCVDEDAITIHTAERRELCKCEHSLLMAPTIMRRTCN